MPASTALRSLPGRVRRKIRYELSLPPHLRAVRRAEGLTSLHEAAMLYDLARKVSDGCIVEVGSYRGRSSVALGLGSLSGHKVDVFAIEPHEPFTSLGGGRHFGPEDRAAFFRAMTRTGAYQVVHLVNLPSTQAAAGWSRPIGMVFIDGDHSYDAVKSDLDSWEPHVVSGGIVVLDDVTEPDGGPYLAIERALRPAGYQPLRDVGKVAAFRKP
jgi:predicted O-methyltransferase YrrM